MLHLLYIFLASATPNLCGERIYPFRNFGRSKPLPYVGLLQQLRRGGALHPPKGETKELQILFAFYALLCYNKGEKDYRKGD